MKQRIVVNGQEYSSPDEMPPDVRAIYDRLMVDRDGNGVPDVIDEARSRSDANSAVITRQEIVINGKTYHSMEEVPVELRSAIEKALGGGDRSSAAAARSPQGARLLPTAQPKKIPTGLPGHEQPSKLPTLLIGAAIGSGLMLLAIWLASRW